MTLQTEGCKKKRGLIIVRKIFINHIEVFDMHCSLCGKAIIKACDIRYGNKCQACYVYYREGGTDNPIPEKGRIAYDYRGYVVCHICGRAYKRLGSHVRESHKMTIAEYKERFGLCNRAKTTENTYSVHMRDLALKNNMDEQLRLKGASTRIKKGETYRRKGKATRLQETIQKQERRGACYERRL